jgi:soluble lytic murein transglycosylase-like protein
MALAIAWQESGWQQHVRSSAGAFGTMQVMPKTGRWISVLVGRRLHLHRLHDNVLAGVVLYKLLRREHSVRGALAGYYQGLGSVHAHGMYKSTKRYIRNVKHLKRAFDDGWRPLG